jgi:hypothetical protein
MPRDESLLRLPTRRLRLPDLAKGAVEGFLGQITVSGFCSGPEAIDLIFNHDGSYAIAVVLRKEDL